MAPPSAVAVLETPTHFLLEGRPDLPGKLAYSGRVQLFGGHIDYDPDGKPIETATQAVRRELNEELNLKEDEVDPRLLWHGEVMSQLRDGTPAWRHVSLFHAALWNSELRMNVSGDIVSIPKTEAGIVSLGYKMTGFTRYVLSSLVDGRHMWDLPLSMCSGFKCTANEIIDLAADQRTNLLERR